MKKILFILLGTLFTSIPMFSQTFIAAEYFIDTDPGTGNGAALSINSNAAQLINTSGVSTGYHTLYIRTQNSDGTWNPIKSKTFYISEGITQPTNFVSGEYYIDNDLGTGNNSAISDLSSEQTILVNEPGFHTLYLRLQDNNNNWSETKSKTFYISEGITQPTNFVSGEYYIDNDLGTGNNSAISDLSLEQTILVNEPGFHTIYLRLQDNNNNWSVKSKGFYVQESTANALIAGMEYFFDTDPGTGNGELVTLEEPVSSLDKMIEVSTTGQSSIGHTISFRLLTEEGNWSKVVTKDFELVDCTLPDKANTPVGYDILCLSGEQHTYTIDNVNNSATYEWKLEPLEAATFTNGTTTSEIDWSESFSGKAYVLVRGYNTCGPGKWSDTLTVEASGEFPCPGDIFYSISDGNWLDNTTWSVTENGQATQVIPGKYNEIRIKGNRIVVSSNTTSGDIFIEADTENETSLQVEDNALLEVYGNIKLEKGEGSKATNIATSGSGQIECK